MTKKKTDHIHRLRRQAYKTGTQYYKCQTCPYLQLSDHIVGVLNICWKCGKPFEMTRIMLRWVKPICEPCRLGTPVEEKASDNALEQLMKEDR